MLLKAYLQSLLVVEEHCILMNRDLSSAATCTGTDSKCLHICKYLYYIYKRLYKLEASAETFHYSKPWTTCLSGWRLYGYVSRRYLWVNNLRMHKTSYLWQHFDPGGSSSGNTRLEIRFTNRLHLKIQIIHSQISTPKIIHTSLWFKGLCPPICSCSLLAGILCRD